MVFLLFLIFFLFFGRKRTRCVHSSPGAGGRASTAVVLGSAQARRTRCVTLRLGRLRHLGSLAYARHIFSLPPKRELQRVLDCGKHLLLDHEARTAEVFLREGRYPLPRFL